MVELVVDAQRGQPGLLGGGCVTCTELDIAEMVQRVGLVETVGELPVEADGPLVARDRLLVVAELMVDVAEAVPGSGLPVALAQLLDRVQRLLAVGDGVLVVAEQGAAVADVV